MNIWRVTLFVAIAFQASGGARPHPRASNDTHDKNENCIDMNKSRQLEINEMVDKMTNFLGNLTETYNHYYVPFLKIELQAVPENENDKVTVLNLAINDCKDKSKRNDSSDTQQVSVVVEEDKTIITEKVPTSENVGTVNSDDSSKVNKKGTNSDETEEAAGDGNKPEILYLQLPENSQSLITFLKKYIENKPIVVYMHEGKQYVLL